ncbi:hypothetical protein VPH35_099636 [Triticum aestivum]
MMGGGLLEHLRTSVWFYVAPVVAACAPIGVLRTYFNQHLRRPLRRLLPFLDPFVTIDITAGDSDDSYYYESRGRAKSSDAYAEVLAYLSAACSREARELRAEGAAEGHGFVLSLRQGQEVADEFQGVTMWWSAVAPDQQQQGARGCCRLTFHERHRKLVVDEYLPHVRCAGQEVTFLNRRRRLYSNKEGVSYYKDYYRRIGKAWKRGYLLYGPPGTGKSTMIAAMANYLNYDIYDIELTTLSTNSDLRKLFIETTGKSIIVIEDIDCSLDLTGNRVRKGGRRQAQADDAHDYADPNRLTLSGLLNFIDGLWSAHSGERIIVFTTNYVGELDPALIRRGRMDMHIEMSYLKFEAFKTLAMNYLQMETHPLFDTIKELLDEVEIAPADVAECLMVSRRIDRDAQACLDRLIGELKMKNR